MLENVVKRSEFGYTREQRYTKFIYYYYYYYSLPSSRLTALMSNEIQNKWLYLFIARF